MNGEGPSVDYASRDNPPFYPFRPQTRHSVKALGFLAAATAIGLMLNSAVIGSKMGWGIVMIPFLWIGGAYYAGARALDSNPPSPTDGVKLLSGIAATLLAPFLLCGIMVDSSCLWSLTHRGWNSNALGDGGRAGFVILAVCLATFAIADVVDLVRFIRRKARSKREAGR